MESNFVLSEIEHIACINKNTTHSAKKSRNKQIKSNDYVQNDDISSIKFLKNQRKANFYMP